MDAHSEHEAVGGDGAAVVGGMHRLFEATTEPMCVADFEGRLLVVNPAWTALLGWPTPELLSGAYLDFVHPDDRAATAAAARILTRGGTRHGFDNRYRHADGTYRWLRWSAVSVVEERRIYAVVRDVTEERERRERLAELERVSGIGTWTLDLETGETRWSAGVHAIYGTDPATFRPGVDDGMRCYPPESRAVLEPAFSRLVEHGEPFDLELGFVTMQGVPRWIRTTGRADLRDGVVLGVSGSFQDITTQRERELRLHQTGAQLDEVQQLARIGYSILDLQNEVAEVSPVVCEILGWSTRHHRVPFAQILELVHPEDLEAFDQAVQEAVTDGTLDIVHRVVRPDGDVRTVRVLARTQYTQDGTPQRLEGSLQDVTDLHETSRALERSEERLRRVLRATADGWWDNDLRTGTVVYSPRWLELHGYGPGELPADNDTWRQLTHPDDLASIDVLIDEVVARRGRTFTVSARILHRRGQLVPVVIRGLIDYDEHGRPIRISGATTDVSEQQRLDAARAAVVSNVSHELRTPLTSIRGAVELLLAGVSGDVGAGQRPLLEVAMRNTDRLVALIEDLLDAERLASGQAVFDVQVQPLGPLLERSLQELAPCGLARGVTFALAELEEVGVEVDAVRLGQVLANLMSNAAKFGPEGSTVELRLRRLGAWARTEVIDRGPGVPEEFTDRVFERFAQADPTGDGHGSAGLGLAISKDIVEQQGGRIGFDSRPGRTCFWFDLPVVEPG